jgi:signal peptidase I
MSGTPEIEPAPPEWGASSSPSLGRRILRMLFELFQTVLIAFLLFIVVNLITARIRVDGISMEPNLHDGEFVVVNRLAYRWQEPKRGDIIVFHFPSDPRRRMIKRVIGLPGNTVTIRDEKVLINGAVLEEPYLDEEPQYHGEWRIGPNEVFVLGDNRNNSSDSQNWGPLDINEIIGKAMLIYWPMDTMGVIPHYDLVTAAEQ